MTSEERRFMREVMEGKRVMQVQMEQPSEDKFKMTVSYPKKKGA